MSRKACGRRAPARHSEPHKVSARSRHVDLHSARNFEAAINAYVLGFGSIDKLRAFVATGDPYISLGHWPGIPAFELDDDDNVDVEATLDNFRRLAARFAAGKAA